MIKHKIGISAFFVAILLVSTLLVPAVSGKADGLSSVSSDDKGKKIIDKSPELKVIEATDTSNIVQVGDLLISFESDPEHTEAKMELKNLTTNEISNFNYKVSKEAGKFKTEVYQEGKLVNTVTSEYNLIEPGATSKILEKSCGKTITVSGTTTLYYWDGVKFIKGSGIKYKHPDYATYDAYPYEGFYINGNKLTHYHIDNTWSGKTAQCVPVVAGTLIGARFGGGWGAAAGALLGLLLDGVACSILLDEQGCIWYWTAKTWGWYVIPCVPPTLAYAPKYCRVATITLWNSIGISSP